MITKVNDTDLKILSLFTKGYNKEYYIREVEKLLKISSRTSFVVLAKLEKQGILTSKLKGKIKMYSIKKSNISKEFLILTEQYKKIQFLEKNQIINEILEKSNEFIQGITIIFGSYAKNTQKNDSDLDIFIIGKYDENKIKIIGEKYGIEINIKSYPIALFKKEKDNDILLNEIKENHILINNSEEFVKLMIK